MNAPAIVQRLARGGRCGLRCSIRASQMARHPLHIGLVGLALVASGCANQAGTPEVALAVAAIELVEPADGVQLTTAGALVEPGDDARLCEVVTLPGTPSDSYAVDRIELAMAAQGRELAVMVAEPGSETAAIMASDAPVPCLRAGEVYGEQLRRVASTQHGYHDQRFPVGVGQVFRGGDRLALEYHYVNETPEPLLAGAKVNLHFTRHEDLARQAQVATFENLTIYTPPDGHSSHLGECLVSEPVTAFELGRRTRHWGTDFRVWIRGGRRDGELIWHSGDYRDTQLELAAPLNLRPGEGLRFECSYNNSSDEDLAAGSGARDEVCALQMSFWATGSKATTRPQRCLLLNVGADGVARASH